MKTPLFVPAKAIISPETAHILKSGHPWVLKDAFTEKFPANKLLLQIFGPQGKNLGLILHDPFHGLIKGRLWEMAGLTQRDETSSKFHSLEETLFQRLQQAIEKRIKAKIPQERENYYLVFGEGDFLPGLFIQVQGRHLLLQYYASFWKNSLEAILLSHLQKILPTFFPDRTFSLWMQERGKGHPFQPQDKENFPGPAELTTVIEEFGIKYFLNFGHYDFGIYTDMAGIRKSLFPYLEKAGEKHHELLNLFSYTGAFSLLGLKYGLKVTSVDLSTKNMAWLEKNLTLNPQLPEKHHRKMILSVDDSLKILEKENRLFHLIICDPPSVSSYGQRKKSALSIYETLLPALIKRTAPQGHLLIFLNTHKVSFLKFKNKIESILKTSRLTHEIKIEKSLNLTEDCPRLNNYPEGDYLKGLILQKISSK